MMQKYAIGDIVDGAISKITPFGAFATIDNKIDGLVHISELSSKRVVNPAEIVKVGEKHKFKIISIEAGSHRLGLSLKAVNEPEEPKKEDKEEVSDKKEKSEDKSVDKAEAKDKKDDSALTEIEGITKKIAENLEKAGYKTVDDLKKLTKDELVAVDGVGDKTADKIMEGLK
jgi:ribosomal protein S1